LAYLLFAGAVQTLFAEQVVTVAIVVKTVVVDLAAQTVTVTTLEGPAVFSAAEPPELVVVPFVLL
jgi:hypothetical protein